MTEPSGPTENITETLRDWASVFGTMPGERLSWTSEKMVGFFQRCAEHIEALQARCEKLEAEMEFYRSLTVSRHDGVTRIDDGSTAEKLDVLWQDKERLDWLDNYLRDSEWPRIQLDLDGLAPAKGEARNVRQAIDDIGLDYD